MPMRCVAKKKKKKPLPLLWLFISPAFAWSKKFFLWAWMYLPGQFFLLGGYPTEFQSREKRRKEWREEKKSEYWIFILICWTDWWQKIRFPFFLLDSAIVRSLFFPTFFTEKRKIFLYHFSNVNQLGTLLNEMEKYFLAQKDTRKIFLTPFLKRKDKKV